MVIFQNIQVQQLVQRSRLTDVIDFRPYVQDDTHDGTTATTFYIANNTDAIANSSILLPDSDTTATLDILTMFQE